MSETKYNVASEFGVTGKLVIVTGGCGGIGKGLVQGLAEAGARVAILDLNPERTAEVAKEMRELTGADVRGYVANITDEPSVEAAMEKVYEDFGEIYGLVNCAGISHVAPLSQMPMDRWQAVMDVNVKGTVVCCKVAGKYMAKDKKGRIVNFSSLAATHGKPGYTAYTPSKAAINAFTFTAAAEWGRLGINVNSISPVIVVTDINRAQVEGDPEYLKRICNVIPQGRICDAKLLCGPVIFLLAPASDFITGQNIGCDGGAQNGDIAVIAPPEAW